MTEQSKPKSYDLYVVNNSIVVLLSENFSVPYLSDCIGSEASGFGVDLTDPNSYDIWDDACLCWNVLEQRHEFHNKANLKKLEHQTDGYIPFDHATGSLKAIFNYERKLCTYS